MYKNKKDYPERAVLTGSGVITRGKGTRFFEILNINSIKNLLLFQFPQLFEVLLNG